MAHRDLKPENLLLDEDGRLDITALSIDGTFHVPILCPDLGRFRIRSRNQRTNPDLIPDSESCVVESDLESESCRFESESDS